MRNGDKYVKKPKYLEIKPDGKYNSVLVSKFVNNLMVDGKKSVAFRVMYDALDIIEKKVEEASPLEVFEKALDNVKPKLEVKSKRVGGSTYQIPMEVAAKRQQTLAIRWVLATVRSAKGKPTHIKLANELMSAFKNEGSAYRKREDTHRMAEANKAFAHFR